VVVVVVVVAAAAAAAETMVEDQEVDSLPTFREMLSLVL
jgi:hypothetical protein